jgi:phage replication O-like protein O
MANPQRERGHIEIANDLFEAIYMRYAFTARQLAVISTVLRYTYGWQRKSAPISLQQIQTATGLDKSNAGKTIDGLAAASVLTVGEMTREGRILSLNKNYDEWRVVKTTTAEWPNQPPRGGQNNHGEVVNSTTDTIQRQYKDTEGFLCLWDRWPESRRKGLSKVTEAAAAEVVSRAEDVQRAIDSYLDAHRETPERYIMFAGRFFSGEWKDYVPAEAPQPKKRGNLQ